MTSEWARPECDVRSRNALAAGTEQGSGTPHSDKVDYASFRPVFNVVQMLYQLLFDIESMLIINIVSMLSRC